MMNFMCQLAWATVLKRNSGCFCEGVLGMKLTFKLMVFE